MGVYGLSRHTFVWPLGLERVGRRGVVGMRVHRLRDRTTLFTTDELHVAYKRGDQALEDLLRRTAPR
jgi:hypothetical protein